VQNPVQFLAVLAQALYVGTLFIGSLFEIHSRLTPRWCDRDVRA
jgi:hypothetical protein